MTIISNQAPSIKEYIEDIYLHRYLIKQLIIRDFKTRYTQTKLGWFWMILQPIFTVVVFSFLFNNILKVDTNGQPYVLIILTGILSWSYFSSIVSNGSYSLVSSSDLIKKVKFPKLSLIISKIFVGLPELLVSYLLLSLALVYYGGSPLRAIVVLPILLFCCILLGVSFAMCISALSVKNRDLLQALPYALSIGAWLSPIYYISDNYSGIYKTLNYLNPISGLVNFSRSYIFGLSLPSYFYLLGWLLAILIFILSFLFFKNIEKDIASIL